MNIQEESDKLRQEAKKIIQDSFKIPDGFESQQLNRLIDCIISAAVLQVASLQEQAKK